MLADWFETPKGDYVLAWERGQFDAAVEDVFGYNAVQLGLPGLDFLRESRIPLKVHAGLQPALRAGAVAARRTKHRPAGFAARAGVHCSTSRDPARGRAGADARG